MKSVKPGRGPSAMSGIGSVVCVIFGIFWTIQASSMGAPTMFPIFGVLFVIIGIVQAIYHFKNATGTNRFSTFDITEKGEETDPWEQSFKPATPSDDTETTDASAFCPYCGSPIESDYSFCNKCGKKL